MSDSMISQLGDPSSDNPRFNVRYPGRSAEPARGEPCVFCEIVAGQAPATLVRGWPDVLALVPLNPVTDGHLIVIPARHVTDAVSGRSSPPGNDPATPTAPARCTS